MLALPLTDTALVYPNVEGDDGYGTPIRVPSETPVIVPCVVYPVSTSEQELLGQAIATVYSLVAASLPGGAWDRIEWDGRAWDALGEPQRYVSPFTGDVLVSLYLKSRGPGPVT